VYDLPEDVTDVPKHIAGVKDYVLEFVSNLCIKFVSQVNFNYSKLLKGNQKHKIFCSLQMGDIQGVPGGVCQTSGECSLCYTILI